MMIIHGLADDNVVVAHSLRLSAALLAAGLPHSVLPLTGVTHMPAAGGGGGEPAAAAGRLPAPGAGSVAPRAGGIAGTGPPGGGRGL